MQAQDVMPAEQARQNMKTLSHDRDEAVAALNEAILEASAKHRGHTTVFVSREHIAIEDLERIVAYLQQRGYQVEDRCHDRDTFALKISWYPGASRRGA